jgi:hypothetical protein
MARPVSQFVKLQLIIEARPEREKRHYISPAAAGGGGGAGAGGGGGGGEAPVEANRMLVPQGFVNTHLDIRIKTTA